MSQAHNPGAPLSRSADSPGVRLRSFWRTLAPLPGGRWLFSRVLGFMVPYTGTMGARVLFFEAGHVQVELRERRRVQNHLRSVHAMALASLGELATGLAVLGALPPTVRGILTDFHMTYTKKARGRLVAECRCPLPDHDADGPYEATAEITDASGDVVAHATATWLLGPVPLRSS